MGGGDGVGVTSGCINECSLQRPEVGEIWAAASHPLSSIALWRLQMSPSPSRRPLPLTNQDAGEGGVDGASALRSSSLADSAVHFLG